MNRLYNKQAATEFIFTGVSNFSARWPGCSCSCSTHCSLSIPFLILTSGTNYVCRKMWKLLQDHEVPHLRNLQFPPQLGTQGQG